MKLATNAIFAFLIAATAASAQVDRGLLNLVMPDAKIVSGIRVDSAKASPFGGYVLSHMQSEDADFQKFVQDTGFDPKRDVTEIVAASAGTTDAPTMLILGRGTFNIASIMNSAQTAGGTATTYHGVQILTHTHGNAVTGAIAFVNVNTAMMGTLSAVQGAIDRQAALNSKTTVPPLSQTVVDKVLALSSANDAWFLSTVPVSDFFAGKFADPNLGGAMQGNLLQAVKQASGGFKFSASGVQISGEAVARSQKDAEALRDVVKFVAGLVQLNKDSSTQAQQVATLVDTIQVSAQDGAMQLSLFIPEQTMEQLFMPGANLRPARARTPRKTASLR